MMISAQALITLRGPQFLADTRLNALIAYVSSTLSSTSLGDRWGEAVGLKVLHILTLEQISGGSAPGVGTSSGVQVGPVVSKSEGDLSITYGTASLAGITARAIGDLASTSFGLELASLIRSSIVCFRDRTI
jgi:hypothetical protein